jgi:hypothetical protein
MVIADEERVMHGSTFRKCYRAGPKLLSKPLLAVTSTGRPLSCDGSTNQIQIGCTIRRIPQLVNILLTDKRCLIWLPISLVW